MRIATRWIAAMVVIAATVSAGISRSLRMSAADLSTGGSPASAGPVLTSDPGRARRCEELPAMPG
ncbi:hypothetical protein PSD17_28770 [Pseudonocardia sp. D17]|nr:hypothetical protein PSD17_28770 [Pseudonocardia sp. D17]